MRISPVTMGLFYIGIGSLFIFFAIQNVRISGWNFFTYLLIALAASDFYISLRVFTMKPNEER